MNYIIIFVIAVLITLFMYLNNIRQTNRDLRRQKQNLQTKIVQEKVKGNIKEFQAYQKAKKETIKKEMKKEANESKNNDINLSLGAHNIYF